ncbi:MAG: MFS transporter [Planctomycetota bacterium]|nr:MFS transporter [Planctomycetaceae bacterium]MDQ3332501.1 MFS transporter [Planctomycetota bacterium]
MSRSRSASLAAIFAVVFIDLLGFGIVLPLLPRYGKYFDAEVGLGALVAVFSAMQFIFAPMWGRLSDRIGRRPVLLVGLAGSVVFYGLFGVATGLDKDATLLGLTPLAWLFISRIGAGIAGATISTAQAYIADVTGPADRAKGMALIGAAFGAGFTFGPLLGAAFVSDDLAAAPSPLPGYLAAGLSAVAFVAAVFVLKEPERLAATQARALPVGRWTLLRDPVRMAIFGQIFLTTAAFAMFESTLALLSRHLGYSDRDNFYLFAFVGVTLTLAQGLLVRRWAWKLGERRMAPLGIAYLAIGLVMLAFLESRGAFGNVIFYGALLFCVIGFAFVTPALQSLLSLTTPADRQGSVLGLGQSASALARIAGPVIGVGLFQRSVPLAYGVAAAVMLAGLAAIFPVLAMLNRHSRAVAASDEAETADDVATHAMIE